MALYTSLLGLATPTTGSLSGSWGTTVNDSITQLIEDSIAGVATASVTASNWTLTDVNGVTDEARCAILIPTGTPGTTRNIVAPNKSKAYFVINQSDSSVVVKASATTGATLVAGERAVVAWSGSDFVKVATSVTGATSVGLSMPSGFTVTNSPVTSTGTLTVTTALSGVLKGTGSGFTAATAGTDYSGPTTGTSSQLLGSNGAGGFTNVTVGSGLSYVAGTLAATAGGGGTVTNVSVTTGNGFAGSVATSTTTPAITLSTTVSGILKGNGTSISQAVSGSDYAPATSGSSILYGNGSGGFSNVTIGSGLSFAAGTLSTSTGSAVTAVFGIAPISSTGGSTPSITLNSSGVGAGSYTLPSITVDTYGRLTSATNGTVNLGTQVTGTLGTTNGGTGSASTQYCSLTTNVTGTLPVGNGGTGATSLTGAGIVTTGDSQNISAVKFFTGGTSGGRLRVGFGSDPTSLWNVAFQGQSAQPALVGYGTGASSTGVAALLDNTSGQLAGYYYGTPSSFTGVGSVTTNGSSAAYNTTSDYRLKENVEPYANGIDRLKLLAPKTFTWKNNPALGRVEGFIAHEVQAVVPDAVHGEKDAVDVDGNIRPQGIDTSVLVPLLTAALQEAVAKIEALEARVAALGG